MSVQLHVTLPHVGTATSEHRTVDAAMDYVAALGHRYLVGDHGIGASDIYITRKDRRVATVEAVAWEYTPGKRGLRTRVTWRECR